MTHGICHAFDRISALLLLSSALFYVPCASSCYFPVELQGEFIMQSTAISSQQVQYSQVSIEPEAIPIWGHCHRRIGLHHAILKDSSGVQDCIRCFLLNVRSRNILQVYTEGLAKCYTTEEAAEATCPQESHTERSDEILLYKMKDLNGDPIPQEYCSMAGMFTFSYNLNDGSKEKTAECLYAVSEIHTCHSGSSINMHFRRCSFADRDTTFQCLGDWEGPDNQRYLALLDTRQDKDTKPRYRCALYRRDAHTGEVEMAFSSDSTCRSDLHSSTSGFETMYLWPIALKTAAANATNFLSLPPSIIGKWQHLDIEHDSIVYRNHDTFKTYIFRSIAPPQADRFLVFGHTLCGEELFSCLWIKERSFNVLEFQMGLHSSKSRNDSLCSDYNFIPGKWNTQGRVENIAESPCPIPGEYTGEIPDENGLCAKLWSHCNTSETMHYTVEDCYDQQVFDGQWRQSPPRRVSRQQHEQPPKKIYRMSSPFRYPTSYHLSTPTSVPVPVEVPYTEMAAYDPWEFPKTHGGMSSLPTGSVRPGPGPGPTVSVSRASVVVGLAKSRQELRPEATTNAVEARKAMRPAPGPLVREERDYQCLGQWEEAGRVYTYTRRSDVLSYECFVGKIVSENSIYIKEAGPWCQREVDPMENGMEVKRQGPCYKTPTKTHLPPHQPPQPPRIPQPPMVSQAPPQQTKQRLPEPTKPWKPITGRPQQANAAVKISQTSVSLIVVLVALAHW